MGDQRHDGIGSGGEEEASQAIPLPEEKVATRILRSVATVIQRALRASKLDMKGEDGDLEWHKSAIRIENIDPSLPWEKIEIQVSMTPRK